MSKITRVAVLAVLVVGAAAILQPADAGCGTRLFTSGDSYLYTPGCGYSGCGTNNSSMTDDAVGAFWAIGAGDPEINQGIDNGTFAFLGGWAYAYPGYPMYFSSHWYADSGIDGCIDVAPDNKCMAVLLMDSGVDTGVGAFALLTDEPDPIGNHNFDQDGPIHLTSLGSLSITGSASTGGGTGVELSVDGISLSEISAGLYLDPNCAQPSGGGIPGVILGYQVFTRETARGAGPPTDNNAENWTPAGPVTPLGDPSTVSLSCGGTPTVDRYIAAGIVFDSGFGTVWLSGSSTRVECGANLVDPEDVFGHKPRSRERRRSRGVSRSRSLR